MRTGKYPINPRIYDAKVVLTAILKLDWAKDVTGAHGLDARLEPIIAKSNEGFVFSIDLQVLIHVPDTKAPRVISMVGSMENLVNEVLQAAVGNSSATRSAAWKRSSLSRPARSCRKRPSTYIQKKLAEYEIETRGVYIQDVVYPAELVTVLTQREVAHQQVETFKMQRQAQDQRIETEKGARHRRHAGATGAAAVGVDIKKNNAEARRPRPTAKPHIFAHRHRQGAQVEPLVWPALEAYRAQVEALGSNATALVNVVTALSEGKAKFVPDVLVTGGGNGGGAFEGLAATAMRFFGNGGGLTAKPVLPPAPETTVTKKSDKEVPSKS